MRRRQHRKVTLRVSGTQEDIATVLLVLATALTTHGIKYSSQFPSKDLRRDGAAVQKSISTLVDDGVGVEFITGVDVC